MTDDGNAKQGVYVVFDGPPGPESGRFIEVEDGNGRGVGPSTTGAWWRQRDDGYWELGPFLPVPPTQGDVTGSVMGAADDLLAAADRFDAAQVEVGVPEGMAHDG